MNMDFRFFLQRFWHRFPWFLIIASVISAWGVSFAMLLPPVYKAQAQLLVENPTIPTDLAASTVNTKGLQALNIIQQLILARTNLLETAQRLKIYEHTAPMTPDRIVKDMRARTVIQLPTSQSAADFVTVSFAAPTAEESARVTNDIVAQILKQDVALRTSTATKTLDFFKQEVARLGALLGQQGDKISQFKLAHKNALPDSLDFRRTQQAAQQVELSKLDREISGLQDQLAQMSGPTTAYKLQTDNLKSQIRFDENQKTIVERELAAIKASIDATPGNAIQLDALQRDYDNTQTQYNAAVARLGAAQTGNRIEALSQGQRISIVDTAVKPDFPTGPKRKLIAVASVLGGIALGLGFVLLLEALNRTVHRPVDLTKKLGIEAFATVPYLHTRGEVLRRRAMVTGVVLVVLVGIPAALYAVNRYYLPLDLLISQTLNKL